MEVPKQETSRTCQTSALAQVRAVQSDCELQDLRLASFSACWAVRKVPMLALKCESKALQIITTGPWNAIPSDLLHQLTGIGFTVEAPSLALLNRAQMYRTAITSDVFSTQDTCFDRAQLDDAAIMMSRPRYWQAGSHFMQMVRN